MPCRPAEYDFGLADGARAYAQAKEHIGHRARVRRMLKYWLSTGAVPPEHLPTCKKLLSVTLNESLPAPPGPDSSEYPEPQDGNWAVTLMYRASHEERQLCEERSLLAALTHVLGAPDKHARGIGQQLELHQEHCEGDRSAVIEALDAALKVETTQNQDERTSELRWKRDRVRRCPIAEIMRDRDVLKPYWP